jgi:hypothetical protein
MADFSIIKSCINNPSINKRKKKISKTIIPNTEVGQLSPQAFYGKQLIPKISFYLYL